MSATGDSHNEDDKTIRIYGTAFKLNYFSAFVIMGVSKVMYGVSLIRPNGTIVTMSDPIKQADDGFSRSDRVSVFVKLVSWIIACLSRGVCPMSFDTENIRVASSKQVYGASMKVKVFLLCQYKLATYDNVYLMYHAFVNLCLNYEILTPSDIDDVHGHAVIVRRLILLMTSLNSRTRLQDEVVHEPTILYTIPVADGQGGTWNQAELTSFIDTNMVDGDAQYVALTLSLMHHPNEAIKDAFYIDKDVVKEIYDTISGSAKMILTPSQIEKYAEREWSVPIASLASLYVLLVRFKYASGHVVLDLSNNLMRAVQNIV